MRLSEAIRHAEIKGKECGLCSAEHAQLANWLKELQRFRSKGFADKVIADLFCGGDGKKVERLVLETPDNHFNGTSGWCQSAVRNVIKKHLKG